METKILYQQVFHQFITNPTIENINILKQFLSVHAHYLCTSIQENVLLTAIFKIIGEVNVR